jgi:oligopeptide/dipeptide ABC transporter ATP-binding protein
MQPVLKVSNLQVSYYTEGGRVRALDGVSFNLMPGEKLGLVGESGSGKSTMALAMMRMIKPPGRIEGGNVLVDGVDLTQLTDNEIREERLSRICYIPQGAMNSLNPVMRIGAQMKDAINAHKARFNPTQLQERIDSALVSVGLKPGVAKMYPHELSGGMKQRVCIAIGILLKPKLIIADEPTSALDVVTQRQVMQTLDTVQKELGAAIILIGHDMGLMAQFVDKVAVMYTGRLMEMSTVQGMFTTPLHPYAQALIKSLPDLKHRGVFNGIPGLAPALLRLPPGCTFHPRCPVATDICKQKTPPIEEKINDRMVACHHVSQIKN